MKALLGLFVDDGMLALALVAVVALSTLVAWTVPSAPMAAGVVLLLGCLGALIGNVIRATQR